nr:hypothetical protein [uncultured Sphaerochaeta sp.]
MAYEIAQRFPDEVLYQDEGPFISLYQPTHRRFPENKQDPIVFKNLLRTVVTSLNQSYKKDIVTQIMEPFHELGEDAPFWNNTSESIAVLASRNRCMVYNLQIPVKEFATVADSFHIKPLIKAFQSMESYQLLGLSSNKFSLYQGDRNGFSQVTLPPDTPQTLEEVLGDQLTESYLSHGAYGGTGSHTMYHGHGDAKQERDNDTEKYFRYVDRFVLDHYSKPSKLPLIVVSLPEFLSLFKNLSNNPYVLDEGIENAYDSLDKDALKAKALEIIKPINEEKIQKVAEAYKLAEAEGLGSTAINTVAKAAFNSRIATLLIEESNLVPGKINRATGEVEYGALDDPAFDDLLDDIAELALMRKGDVLVIPKDMMPSTTGVAAIFRY